MVPILLFVAPSGAGKTTLLEKVVIGLKGRGYKVGAMKHTGHSVAFDKEGSDSWRFSRAGADVTVISSPGSVALRRKAEEDLSIDAMVQRYGLTDLDIMLVEGHKQAPYPKIEIHRECLGPELLCRGGTRDPFLEAIASDTPLEVDVPVLPLDNAGVVCDFIVKRFLER
ncbi:MAG: molybdopterin-guanine dinucleotide biosynthesis protein B [Deltaproteobacteria bacterium]|nr:molybdopterin-guanine dinucleotide biosynthesis protein B [Deltaproteobacteria bacterium]